VGTQRLRLQDRPGRLRRKGGSTRPLLATATVRYHTVGNGEADRSDELSSFASPSKSAPWG
jgi:hypothetical protein